jgi:hypothetical protein
MSLESDEVELWKIKLWFKKINKLITLIKFKTDEKLLKIIEKFLIEDLEHKNNFLNIPWPSLPYPSAYIPALRTLPSQSHYH